MSFAGSKHFPGRGMVDYLETLGMKFGRDINAVTGYDRTIFMLTVPMDKLTIKLVANFIDFERLAERNHFRRRADEEGTGRYFGRIARI